MITIDAKTYSVEPSAYPDVITITAECTDTGDVIRLYEDDLMMDDMHRIALSKLDIVFKVDENEMDTMTSGDKFRATWMVDHLINRVVVKIFNRLQIDVEAETNFRDNINKDNVALIEYIRKWSAFKLGDPNLLGQLISRYIVELQSSLVEPVYCSRRVEK